MEINGGKILNNPSVKITTSFKDVVSVYAVLAEFKEENALGSFVREIGSVQYINKEWTLVENTENTEDVKEVFSNINLEELELKDLDYHTPPDMSKYGILIPEKYQFIFRDYVFKVGGFEVPLEDDAKGLYVNVSYLGWQAFRDELDKEENQYLKLALEPVWDYAKEQAEKNNLILLEEF